MLRIGANTQFPANRTLTCVYPVCVFYIYILEYVKITILFHFFSRNERHIPVQTWYMFNKWFFMHSLKPLHPLMKLKFLSISDSERLHLFSLYHSYFLSVSVSTHFYVDLFCFCTCLDLRARTVPQCVLPVCTDRAACPPAPVTTTHPALQSTAPASAGKVKSNHRHMSKVHSNSFNSFFLYSTFYVWVEWVTREQIYTVWLDNQPFLVWFLDGLNGLKA